MAAPTVEAPRQEAPPRTVPPWTSERVGLVALVVVTRLLGLVGGGGLGAILQQATQILAYRTIGAIVILMFVVVLALEIVTNWLRKQLI
jgi:phosphonate transport system permease protein